MKKLLLSIPFSTALVAAAFILSSMVLFHLVVLTGIIPFDMVWGGQLQSQQQVIVFESTSILFTSFIIFVVAMRAGWVKKIFARKLITISLFASTILFALSTLGNLLSLNSLEAIIFAPLSAILVILFIRIIFES